MGNNSRSRVLRPLLLRIEAGRRKSLWSLDSELQDDWEKRTSAASMRRLWNSRVFSCFGIL